MSQTKTGPHLKNLMGTYGIVMTMMKGSIIERGQSPSYPRTKVKELSHIFN
jgi:hypothetical protein